MADNFYASYPVGGGGSSVVSVTKVTQTYSDFSVAAMTKTIALSTVPAGAFLQYAMIVVNTPFSGPGITMDAITINYPSGTVTKDPSLPYTGDTVAECVLSAIISFSISQDITTTLTTSVGNLNGLTAGSADIYLVFNNLEAT